MTTAAEFLAQAPRGGSYVYFTGRLGEQEPHPDKLLDACVLYEAAKAGAVFLVQRRAGRGFEYIAQAGPKELRTRTLVEQYHKSGQVEARSRSEAYNSAGLAYAGPA